MYRPSSHAYDPDERGDCVFCGYGTDMHREDYSGPVEDDPIVRGCKNCDHYEHRGPCPDALPGYPKARPCNCEGVAA